MIRVPRVRSDQQGAAVIELAFGLPALIMLIWMIYQLGLVFRANSGIQHSLGQGARYATLYPTPTNAQIQTKMNEAVYGIGPGTFAISVTDPVDDPATSTVDESKAGYKDLTMTYSQQTSLLVSPGPMFNLRKAKRVWVAGADSSTPPPSCSSTSGSGVPGGGSTCSVSS